MSFNIIKRPILDEGGVLIFRWNAADNPVVYELQREDRTFISIADDGGFVQVVNIDITGREVGEVVFFHEDGSVYPDELTTITALAASRYTLNIPFTAVSGAGFINLNEALANYRWDVFFFDPDNGDVKYFTEGVEFAPRENGLLVMDVSAIMRSFLDAEYLDTQEQEDLSLRFYPEFIERFNNTVGLTRKDTGFPVGLVTAAKQLLDLNGSIMKDWTFVIDAGAVAKEGLWLSRFDNPSWWEGHKNWGFWIDNDYGAGFSVIKEGLDVNGDNSGTAATGSNTGVIDEVNKIEIETFSGTPASVNVSLAIGGPITFFDFITPKNWKIREPCKNPVMVLWLNSLGGFSQWLFENVMDANVLNQLGDIFEVPFSDIEVTNRVLRQRDSSYSHEWILNANDLTTNELLAIAEIKNSSAVYVQRIDGEVIGVIAEGLDTTYRRDAVKHRIIVTIRWPRDFNPEKWLLD